MANLPDDGELVNLSAMRVLSSVMRRQHFTNLFFSMILSLGLAACVSTPRETSANQQSRSQQTRFAEAKALFLSRQYGAAASALLPLAQQGHPGAQYTIGYMYHYGYGLPRNERESVRWIATAAARGHAQAKQALARINTSHDRGGVTSAKPPKAARPGVIRLE